MTIRRKATVLENEQMKSVPKDALTCGIIMPIATMGSDYPESHWTDIRHIINRAIQKAGFIPRIVSDSEDSTIIHKSIINNIYNDPIIVCDVSNKNANVMFELGMRLAFNKPVVIIKDDQTGYSFDTSNIQHLGYRKDLRHNTIEKFIEDLANKIRATYEAPNKDGYQSFLSHFGKFEIASIENQSIQEGEAIQKLLEKVTDLEQQIYMSNHLPKSINSNFKLHYMIPLLTVDFPPNIERPSLNLIVDEVKDLVVSLGMMIEWDLYSLRVYSNSNVDSSITSSLQKDINMIIERFDSSKR